MPLFNLNESLKYNLPMCRNIIHSILRKVVLYNQYKEQSKSERNKDDSERELKGRVSSVKVLRPMCTKILE